MRYQKILIVNPPFPREGGEVIRPSAGLGYLAEALHQAGLDYDVLDMNLGGQFKHLKSKIAAFSPDLIGVTLLSLGYKNTFELISKIKSNFPDTPIIVGGPHMTLLREKVLEACPAIDYGVIFEGEKTLVELCLGEKEITQIGGLYFRENAEIYFNGPREYACHLDELSFPRFEKFELKKYVPEAVIISSRGCPYSCIFCPNRLITAKFRMRSAVNVVDEMEYWYQRGYRQFNFDDDNFNQSKARVHEICNLIEARGLKNLFIRCSNGLRADKLDREVLKRMWQVGFRYLGIGVDGGNDRVLTLLQKGERLSDIENAIQLACEIGFGVKLFFVVGTPGETWNDILDSARLAQKYPIQRVHFYNLIPYPGTKVFEYCEQNQAFLRQPEEYLNSITDLIYEPLFETPELSREKRIAALKYLKTVSRQITRQAVIRMFARYKMLNQILAHIFTTNLLQRWVFQNVLFRRLVEVVRYRKSINIED